MYLRVLEFLAALGTKLSAVSDEAIEVKEQD